MPFNVYSTIEADKANVPRPVLGPRIDGVDVTIMNDRYDGFPKAHRVPGQRRIGTTINSTIDHAGSDHQGSIKIKYSDDQGATWSAPFTIFGDGGLDCYTNSIGIDEEGTIHFWCRERSNGNLLHRTTRDWVTFSSVDTIASASVTGGSGTFTLTNFRLWGKFQPNPAGTGMVGGGYWTDGASYEIYHVVTDALGINIVLTLISAVTDPPAYNEAAHYAPTGDDRFALVRQNGIRSPAQFVSHDRGATWSSLGDMDIPVSGGWLPQEMDVRVRDGIPYLLAFIGHRRPGSSPSPFAEPYPGPGVGVWFCPLKDALATGTGWKMGHAHTWAHAANNTDAYCSQIYDPVSGNTLLFSYDELSDTSARTFVWLVSDVFHGPRTPDAPEYLETWQAGQAAFLDRKDVRGSGVTILSAVKTVTSADDGKSYVTTTADSVTLPLAADVPEDFFLDIKARGANSSVICAGADTIDGGTSLTIADGSPAVRIKRATSSAWESF